MFVAIHRHKHLVGSPAPTPVKRRILLRLHVLKTLFGPESRIKTTMNCRNQTFQTQYCNADLRHSLQQRSIEQKIRRLCIPLEKNPAVFAGSCFLPAFSRPQVYPALRGAQESLRAS